MLMHTIQNVLILHKKLKLEEAIFLWRRRLVLAEVVRVVSLIRKLAELAELAESPGEKSTNMR